MFEVTGGLALIAAAVGVVVQTDAIDINSILNFVTVALIVWHNRHVKTRIEPQVEETAALVKRRFGERTPSRLDRGGWDGTERRKGWK